MRIAALATVLALSLLFTACGGDDESKSAQFTPAAGENTPPDTTPGVPPGSSYDLNGNEWLELDDPERFEAAQDYVSDHPDECTTEKGTAAGDPVRRWADGSVGSDYPLTAPIAELLDEGCAAALASGDQGLAPEE